MGNKSHFFRQSSGGGGDAFIATFRTTTDNESITLPYASNGTYSGTIDWGDGTIVENSYANRAHNYAVSGDYDVTVLGELKYIRFLNNPEALKIINIKNWGNNLILGTAGTSTNSQNSANTFRGCKNLDITATDILDCSTYITFKGFFMQDFNMQFNESINTWNISNVTNMGSMFNANYLFNQPLNNWNTSNVTDMSYCFYDARLFNQPLNNWNTSKVASFQAMFFGANIFNQDISLWDFSGANDVNSFSDFMRQKSQANYNANYYDNLLIKWASDPSLGGLQPNIIGTINMGSIKYTANGAAARQSILDNNKAVTITDGGQI